MHAAAMRIELYLRECRSLKSKRAVVKPMTEGLRRRYQVAVAEVAYQDSWHRTVIGVAAVASSHAHLTDVLHEVERFVWSFPEAEVLHIETQWIDRSSYGS